MRNSWNWFFYSGNSWLKTLKKRDDTDFYHRRMRKDYMLPCKSACSVGISICLVWDISNIQSLYSESMYLLNRFGRHVAIPQPMRLVGGISGVLCRSMLRCLCRIFDGPGAIESFPRCVYGRLGSQSICESRTLSRCVRPGAQARCLRRDWNCFRAQVP